MAGPVYHMAHAMAIRDDDLSPADEFLRLIQNPFKETVSPCHGHRDRNIANYSMC
jgi:hypothetical protein